jgi:hypothetical protein
VAIDLSNVMIELNSPLDALPLGCGRNLNSGIAVAEALQLIGGFSDPARMCELFPSFRRFMDDGRFWGAYGTRVGIQLQHAVRKLKTSPDTRQAVVTLWSPTFDNVDGKHDYPCTIALGFRIIGDELNMNVLMRSNDVWLGLPYDMFQFTQLQLTMCNALDIGPGRYNHHAWSLHLYHHNRDAAYAMNRGAAPKSAGVEAVPVTGIGLPNMSMLEIGRRARRIWNGNLLGNLGGPGDDTPTATEFWYRRMLIGEVESETSGDTKN